MVINKGGGKGAVCNADSSVWFCVDCGHCLFRTHGWTEGSDVSERWHPVGQGLLGLWSERHCWNCSLWGWQRHSRCRYLPQYCSGPPGKVVPEGCSLSEWVAHWRTRRRWKKGCPRERCCPLADLAGPDHRRGGVSPSLCVGRRSRSSELCCSRCTSRWLSCHSSSNSHSSLLAGWWPLARLQKLVSLPQPVPSPFWTALQKSSRGLSFLRRIQPSAAPTWLAALPRSPPPLLSSRFLRADILTEAGARNLCGSLSVCLSAFQQPRKFLWAVTRCC